MNCRKESRKNKVRAKNGTRARSENRDKRCEKNRDRRTCRQRLSERDKSTMNVRVKALGRLCKT